MRERFAMNAIAALATDSKSFAPKILPASLNYARIWRDQRRSKTNNSNQSNGLARECLKKNVGGTRQTLRGTRYPEAPNLPLRQKGLLFNGDVRVLLGLPPHVDYGDCPERNEIDTGD
jgi:hypothetical protein